MKAIRLTMVLVLLAACSARADGECADQILDLSTQVGEINLEATEHQMFMVVHDVRLRVIAGQTRAIEMLLLMNMAVDAADEEGVVKYGKSLQHARTEIRKLLEKLEEMQKIKGGSRR